MSYRENQSATYRLTLAKAQAAQDADSLARLSAIGPPPWQNPRNSGVMRRITRHYEGLVTDPASGGWWRPAPDYATAQDLADQEAGDDYSYLQFVGLRGDGPFSTVDLPALGLTFATPFFLIQGTEDLVTAAEVTERYFERVVAPRKALVRVPRTGHDPNQPMVEAQFRLLQDEVKPRIAGD